MGCSGVTEVGENPARCSEPCAEIVQELSARKLTAPHNSTLIDFLAWSPYIVSISVISKHPDMFWFLGCFRWYKLTDHVMLCRTFSSCLSQLGGVNLPRC